MFAKQSYWYKLRGLWFKLKFYWVHIDWLAPGHPMGAGNPTISRETKTQVPACQPQPRQPHIKLISQLQKSTRKISDTWIIDTDNRETRYQLVKVHQTIRRPHNTTLTDSFSYLEPVCSMSGSNCCFLTCIQISQEAGHVVWYSISWRIYHSLLWSTQRLWHSQ